jgi:glyoxylase-like metal-dependent hydrolase (beta-lactamase superfamily II)/rhodanese-related sulfurtransferase
MKIEQIYTGCLAQGAYYITSNGEAAIIDPLREVQPYLDRAEKDNVKIKYVFETHFHADFVSGHIDLSNKTGAPIVYGPTAAPEFDAIVAKDNEEFKLGNIIIKVLHTPGHTMESTCYLLKDEHGKEHALFSGDTLFLGDVGRPDLAQKAVNMTQEELAGMLYHSLYEKILPLSDDIMVYPAHGAGSLCGKGLSSAESSNLGAEKLTNWSLQAMTEEMFMEELLADQPFIPAYFPMDVDINKKGAQPFLTAVSSIKIREEFSLHDRSSLNADALVIDTRAQSDFKKAHFSNAINLMDDTKYETWLGSIVKPGEPFYLIVQSKDIAEVLIARIAKIGYENQLLEVLITDEGDATMDVFDSNLLVNAEDDFTLVDVRNHSEVRLNKVFANAIHIPLHELRERTNEIPEGKPVVIHCAGGYRSAAGSSIVRSLWKGKNPIYDLSFDIKKFNS